MLTFFTLLTFAVTAGLILSAYYAMTAESPVEQRVRSLVPEGAAASARRQRAGRGAGVLRRTLGLFGQIGLAGDDRSLTQLLSVAGIRGRGAVALFVGTRTLLSVVPAVVLLFAQVSSGKPLSQALRIPLAVWFVGHFGSNYWVRRRGRNRMRDVESALPDSLDLMVVCLEAGLGLNATIARVGEERSTMNDPLGQEFSQVALELREGRSREDALRGLGERNGVEDLRSLAALIIQSDRLGASMAKTLRAHADVLRTKRRQRAEEAARKLPIKMLFPLGLFVLPAIIIVAVGPAILQIQQIFGTLTKN